MKRRVFSSIRAQVWLIIFSMVLVVLVLWTAFYRTSSGLIEQKTAAFVRTLLLQSAENIKRTADEMVYVANTLVENETIQQFLLTTDPLVKLGYGRTLSDFTLGLLQHSNYVAHVNIVDLNDSIISSSQQNVTAIDYLDETYRAFDEDVYLTGFIGQVHNSYDGFQYVTYVRPIYHTLAGAKLKTKIGTCVVFCNVSNLNRFLTQSAATDNATFMLLDESRRVIAVSAGGAQITAALVESLDQIDAQQTAGTAQAGTDQSGTAQSGTAQAGTVTLSLGGRACIVDQHEIADMGWRLISAVPAAEITNDLDPLVLLGTLTCGLFALLAVLWGFQIRRGITSPLISLTNFIHEGIDESLTQRVPITGNNEIGMLCEQFNTLLDRIADMTGVILGNQANMYELNLAKKRAELSALQSQINPHFLYNTLDCIKGYGYLLESQEIVQIANALSAIMRYCIKGSDAVLLKNELDIVESYLKIIAIRFEGRFDFRLDIDPPLLDAEVPRFILQPIVENAVYHGLEPKLSHGTLCIAGHAADGALLLRIADDGIGMSAEVLEQARAQLRQDSPQHPLATAQDSGLALANIHTRIRGIYGDGYGLTISSVPGAGTEVVIRMPLSA